MSQAASSIAEKVERKIHAVHHAFSSRAAFIQAIETKPYASRDDDRADTPRNPWSNEDLDISPESHRTWLWYDYASFWWTYGFSPGTWYQGAALLAVGLTAPQAVACIVVSYIFGAIGVVLHSRAAAVYHFGFPVESRIFWGLRGAYLPILFRALTALIWAGVVLTTGGYYTAVLLRCIFGSTYWDMPNHIPASSGITVQNLIGVLVYWGLTCWLLNVPIPKLRRWFEVKAVIIPPVIFGLFIWCMVKGRNVEHKDMYQIESKTGSELGWAMMAGINSMMSKTSTLMVNQPDIARYSRDRWAPVWSQLLFLPLGGVMCSVFGIYATERIFNVWGNIDWNPWTLNHDMLDHDWSAGTRAGLAIMNLLFIFANALTELAANVIPFGADFMSVFPRWLNIRRGMWMAYILGLCINPWYILASAGGFLTFLNGYGIFLGPIMGIAITDYFVIRKGNVHVSDLYQRDGRYWYTAGVGWRPVVTMILTVAFVIPGFAATFGHPLAGNPGWTRLYSFSWFYTCTVSSVIYFAISFVGDYAKDERSMPFEALANREVIEQDEESIPDVAGTNITVTEK